MPSSLGRVFVGLACAFAIAIAALVAVDALVGPMPTASYSGDLARIPYHAGQSWTGRFVADQDQVGSARVRYHPFTVWRRPPHASETVNVGEDGHRVVPGADCSPDAKKVWFFGGSTMWGTSSPDWGTIPAIFVAEMRNRSPVPICARNFGESAWTSTQELIALVEALQGGETPDLAVFYDGANDLYFTFENGDPYGHADLARVAGNFDREERGRGARRPRERRARDLLRAVAPNVADRLDQVWPQFAEGVARRESRPAKLASEAVRVLRVNREVVRALARRFGFEAAFFWQPYLLAGRKPLAPGEAAMLANPHPRRRAFIETVERANRLVEEGLQPDETDLSRVFGKVPEQLFTDPVHVTPRGNEIVAQAMAAVIGDRVLAAPRGPSASR